MHKRRYKVLRRTREAFLRHWILISISYLSRCVEHHLILLWDLGQEVAKVRSQRCVDSCAVRIFVSSWGLRWVLDKQFKLRVLPSDWLWSKSYLVNSTRKRQSWISTYSLRSLDLLYVIQMEDMTGVFEHLPAAVRQGFVQVEHQGVVEPRRAILLQWTKLYVLKLDSTFHLGFSERVVEKSHCISSSETIYEERFYL